MTLDQLFLWHREQHERWAHLAEHNKANVPMPYKASLKRAYEKKAAFHAEAASLIKPFRDPMVVALFGEYVRAEA